MTGNLVFFTEVDFTVVVPKNKPKQLQQPDVTLEDLDRGVSRAQSSAFAEGTLKNLTTQWVRYLTFCTIYQINPFPASIEDLCRFAQYLSLILKSHQSILNYISGVKTLHKLLKFETAQFTDLLVVLTLRGLHRLNTHVPKQSPPVSLEILDRISKLIDFDNEDDVIFWAVVLIGFFLLLRKSNLVPDTGAGFDSDRQLKRGDLEIFPDFARVTLRWTKNEQVSKKPLRFALPVIPGSLLCPVEAILRVISMVDGNPNDSLFKKSNGSTYTYRQLQSKLAIVSDQLGLSEKLTSHSLRAGARPMPSCLVFLLRLSKS